MTPFQHDELLQTLCPGVRQEGPAIHEARRLHPVLRHAQSAQQQIHRERHAKDWDHHNLLRGGELRTLPKV